MAETLVIVPRLFSGLAWHVVRYPDRSSEGTTIGQFATHPEALEHVRLTATDLGAEPIEVEVNAFALVPTDDPANVLRHEPDCCQ